MFSLTIITICFNEAQTINKTIESVKNFKNLNQNIEYIVVDGNSDDGTVEKIKDHIQYIDKFISENDMGIYDAMNKGIRLAKGKYICFINSGDILVFPKKLNFIEFDEDIISFGKSFEDFNGNIKNKVPNTSMLSKVWEYMPLNHQGLFIKNSIYKKYGLYDLNFKICSDNEWLLRYIIKSNQQSINFQNKIMVGMSRGGISDQESSLMKMTIEHFLIRKKYNYNKILNLLLSMKYFLPRYIKFKIKKYVFNNNTSPQ